MTSRIGQNHPAVQGDEPSPAKCGQLVHSVFGNYYENNVDVVDNPPNNPVPVHTSCPTTYEPQSPFHFLALAAELRFIVYRELWTLPVDHDLTTGLGSLALTCRQSRKEVLYEYIIHILPLTQIHLGKNRMVLKGLKSASFLTRHIQHGSLLMGRCFCDDDPKALKSWNYKGLIWLADHVPNLKTLEVVFTEEHYHDMRSLTKDASSMPANFWEGPQAQDHLAEWHSDVMETWFCLECWQLLLDLPRTLEKVTFKVWSAAAIDENEDPAAGPVAAVKETWDITEWWHKMKFYDDRYYEPVVEYVAQAGATNVPDWIPCR